MTYQTAYKLLVAAYKSAKGIMPEGIDLLKLKMKARQKVIDAKKVIQFPPERITNPFKARPPKQLAKYEGGGEGIKRMIEKGLIKIGEVTKRKKVKEPVDSKLIQEERIKEIMKQNKASAKRLQEKMNKPEKSLGEKLRDYDGDPDAMAGGGKVKKPFRSKVVDFLGGPAVVGAELGLSGLLEVYNLLGMPLMKDGGKVKKKRKHDDNIDEEDIGEGKSKERFLRVMPEVDGISRSDGIMELAAGGMTNISDTYDNNPTLQSQYPNKQDYLDLFSSQTTTTTPEVAAIPETTTSTIAPINPIKPIIKIPQSSGDSGGITTIQPKAPKDPLTFRESMAQLNLQRGVPVEEEEKSLFEKITGSPFVKYNPMNPAFLFNVSKAGLEKTREFAKQVQAQKALEAEQERQAQINAARAALAYQTQTGEGSGYTGGFDSSTQNYDDPFDPGQTE